MAPAPDPVRHPAPVPLRACAAAVVRSPLAWSLGALLVVAGAVAIPYHSCCEGCGSSEVSAISTLRNVASAQDLYRLAATVDEDGDGVGEFGGLLEMAAAVAARGRQVEPMKRVPVGCAGPRGPGAPPVATVLVPARTPLLSGAFRTAQPGGEVRRSGYSFRVYLPARDGTAATEAPGRGFAPGTVDPDAAETRWIAYAWPVAYGTSGTRTFAVDQTGEIVATDCPAYTGATGPPPGAAQIFGSPASLRSRIVPDVPAQDGNVWRSVR